MISRGNIVKRTVYTMTTLEHIPLDITEENPDSARRIIL